ncbi:hypothetical protein RCOM_0798260 [Ricinus communis]|uniref:Uncharacterized protein n=1 Tax=Ricinus communis TaxID=3988 RepID=B9RRU7_RICCO|nr:hypothetical protein RCOM_0798260 [Ricinus communis]
MNQTRPNSNDDVLQSMVKESIHRFLTEYKNGTTDFSNFASIFSRFLNILPDPPLEIIWFYSALTFHSAKLTAHNHVLLAKDLFQLLVSCCSSSCSVVKKIAVVAPVIYEISSLVCKRKEWIKEIESLLVVTASYISICLGSNFEGNDEVMILDSCFVDLVRVWVVDKIDESCQFDEVLRVFFPLVNDGILRRFASEGNGIGTGYLAGIVMSQVLLLSLCLKFESRVSRVELEKELRERTVQTMTAFPTYDFFDTVLRMLLEPVLPIIPLLSSEDEVIVRKILYDTAMTMEFSCPGPDKGIKLLDERLKNLAITWLFVAENGIRFFRENADKTKVICYLHAFSESCLPSKLIKWVTNQPGMHNLSIPKISSPLALISEFLCYLDPVVISPNSSEAWHLLQCLVSLWFSESIGNAFHTETCLTVDANWTSLGWLLIVEDKGVQVFDSDISKIYVKTIISKPIEYRFFEVKSDGQNLGENHFSCKEDKGENKVDGDLEMVDSEDTMFLAAPAVLKVTAASGTRKRKEERKDEEGKQIKFVKGHLYDNLARETLKPSDDYDALSSCSKVDNPASDDCTIFMEQ